MPFPQDGNQGQGESEESEILKTVPRMKNSNKGEVYKEVFSSISKEWVENTVFHCSKVVC